MKEIRIRIRKKTTVPTKYQMNHQFRSDWNLVGVIDYPYSSKIFYNIGGGPVKTEAQLAQLIYTNYGPGIYSCLYWQKGKRDFDSFWKAQLDTNGWVRLPKNKSEADNEIEYIKNDLNDIKRKKANAETDEEYREYEEEESELYEDLNAERNKKKSDRQRKRGPTPWVKASKPVYRYQDYEDYKNQRNNNSGVIEYY